MPKSNILLGSIGAGFFTLAILRIEVPIGIMVGLTVFASIFAISVMLSDIFDEIKITSPNRFNKTILKLLRFSAKMLILFSVPISIYMAAVTFTTKSIMTAVEIQTFMTLYSLALLFISLSNDIQSNRARKDKKEIDRLNKLVEELKKNETI
ncbi:hypothetical protein OR571_01520 [Psychrobacillus sp. NEAU-3TGS]|uniref:hypothetical protein n=1 Tax=Psychrobacillus sp. NEAU-3TGS TaxID=2995412 RepID=UPI0024984840|nr:hypothetical protein [Psychrobacillus sp. NEAU-3TGS]MDI2585840.1 hypothetical protein [Psychrobacillus sp. NEAU-3TGS]